MTEQLVAPVAARLVRPQWAPRVVSPAYDSMGSGDRAALMDADPLVFLHVTRSAAGSGLTEAEALDANAAALDRLLKADVFTDVQPPALYVYRLRSGGHAQLGVVADVPVAGVASGQILPHERTRPQRASALADHLARVRINASPIAMAHRPDAAVDALVAEVISNPAELDFQREDLLQQTIWRVDDELATTLAQLLSAHTLYIVDGHHRVAAATEFRRRTGEGERLLAAIFPANQLRTLAFHRRVADLGGATLDQYLEVLHASPLQVTPQSKRVTPTEARTFGMYAAGQWWRLDASHLETNSTDTTILQDLVLGPLLHVDEGADPRLSFLPGPAGLERLVAECDDSGGVAFSLSAFPVPEMMRLVDGGLTLPPKSTYFEPKVRSGVFLAPR